MINALRLIDIMHENLAENQRSQEMCEDTDIVLETIRTRTEQLNAHRVTTHKQITEIDTGHKPR